MLLGHQGFEARQGQVDLLEAKDQQASEVHQDAVDQMVVLDRLAQVVTPALLGQQESVVIPVNQVSLDWLDREDRRVCPEVLEFVEMKADLVKLAGLE